MCITREPSGAVWVRTINGVARADYSASALLQPPIINSILPAQWNSSGHTTVTFIGERFGVLTNITAIQMRLQRYRSLSAADCPAVGALECVVTGSSLEAHVSCPGYVSIDVWELSV